METHASAPASGLPGTVVLLKGSCDDFVSKAGNLIPAVFIPMALTQAAFFLAAYLTFGPVMFSSQQVEITEAPALWGSNFWVLPVAWIAAIVVSAILTVMYTYAASKIAGSAKAVPFAEALRDGWKHLKGGMWVIGLIGFFTLGGFGLLGFPGVYLSILLSYGMFVFALDGTKGFGALMRSRQLVKPFWWPVFGRSLLVGLIVGIASAVVSAVLAAIPNPTVYSIVNLVVTYGLFVPFAISYSARVYRELVSRVTGPAPTAEESKAVLKKYVIVGVVGTILFLSIPMFAVATFVRTMTSVTSDSVVPEGFDMNLPPGGLQVIE